MFKGSIVALITPMDRKGKICRRSLKKLIQYHIKNGTKAIVSVGTTGESATLNKKEHINLIKMTIDLAEGKIPIIAGTGSNSTKKAIILNKKFEKSGISGCLSVTPYYNKPTQKGLYLHFKSISENTSLLQILYNVPSRTGCDLSYKTIKKLSKFKNIIGIKEASGDLSRVSRIKELVNNENFFLISGDDKTALDFIKLGGNGVISVTANVAAAEMAKMCSFALKGKFEKAKKINKKLNFLHTGLFKETNPIPVKWVAKKIGLIKNNSLRLPLTKISKKVKNFFKKKIKKHFLKKIIQK